MSDQTFAGQAARFAVHRITLKQYIAWIRSWHGRPRPEGLPEVSLSERAGAKEVVREGYGSVYRFADKLREMAGDESAEVMSVPLDLRDGAYRGTLYFCWRPAGPATGYPRQDQERDWDEVGVLATYTVGPTPAGLNRGTCG